jgi:hypothetical protein
MLNKKIIGILVTSSDYKIVININNFLYDKILKEFKELYIINLENLILFKKKKNNKKIHFKFNKIKVFKPNNSSELINFFKNKKLIAFNCIGKNFLNFKIYYILNKINLTQILLLNIGYLNNIVEINLKDISNIFSNTFFVYNKKITAFFFKIFTILNLFPKINYYFDSSKLTIKNINKSFIRKLEKIFPKIKISYFRKAININSRSYDQLIDKKIINKNKYIVFIDSYFEHGDRILREGSIKKSDSIKYYFLLGMFLKKLSKIYNKKIVICVHPKNNNKLFFNHFKNFIIKKYKTQEMIQSSFITLFHESSAILDAILLNKNIILLKTNLLGNYLSNRVQQYERELNILSIDIDDGALLNKKRLNRLFSYNKNKYRHYIKSYLNSDGVIPGYQKIIKLIKKI